MHERLATHERLEARARIGRLQRPPVVAARRPRGLWRTGLTFLETVCAVALLGLLAATMLGAVGYLYNSQHRDRQRLACAELANRLILQYLDDKDAMPSPDAPLEYGHERYRWEMREEAVQLRPTVVNAAQPGRQSPTNRLDRMQLVTIRVWLSEESGGSRELALGVPTSSLWRMVDPIAFRNPDAINRMMSTDAGRRRLMESMLGGGAPPPPRGAPGAGGRRDGGSERPR